MTHRVNPDTTVATDHHRNRTQGKFQAPILVMAF